MKPSDPTRRLIIAALLTALVCIATLAVRIPAPSNIGYLNAGDGVVLLCGWLLPPGWGFLAAGLGAGIADLLAGYVVYAPVTLVVKGLMALTAWGLALPFRKRGVRLPGRLLGGLAAETIMVAGYFLYESILYGLSPAAANLAANALQAAVGLILGVLLITALEKTGISRKDAST